MPALVGIIFLTNATALLLYELAMLLKNINRINPFCIFTLEYDFNKTTLGSYLFLLQA